MKRRDLHFKDGIWLSRSRYLELFYLCQQYEAMKLDIQCSEGLSGVDTSRQGGGSSGPSNPTMQAVLSTERQRDRVAAIESAARMADSELAAYIIENVSQHHTYDQMTARYGVLPKSRGVFYQARRMFFYILDKKI